MSDTMRMTGLYSGMDTETIIQSLVSTKSQKVTDLKNEQKKLEWKQNAWQELNSKIYSFYSKTLSNMRLQGSYAKKTTKISDSTKATIVAGDNAVNGTQTLKINSVAKSGYLTGAEISKDDGSKLTGDDKLMTVDTASLKDGATFKLTVGKDDNKKETEITIDSSTTINDFVKQLKAAGVNASFDETNQRFFISSTSTGEDNNFELTGDNAILSKLGLDYSTGGNATKINGSNAEIELNGATFKSNTNSFSVNGLTINVTGVTGTDETLTITTDTDYDGIYDMIKDFVSEYNDIINDIYQKYNADSARKYSMLTDDEKESMTDDEIETWEDTIKASLLRKDTTLQSLMSSITSVMNDSYGYDSNGKKRYLFSYGIETLGYFEAEEGERYALHIAGDPDDESTSSDDDLLKTAIANDPDGTVDFFSSLCKTLYTTLNTAMKATDYSSIYKVYEDKRLQTEYDDYTTKISEAEDKLSDYEDKWYSKFSAMETALSKLQSNQSVISSMLGTS
jgi:flagellar hook-associated protein 2